jgi:hypothetical protein
MRTWFCVDSSALCLLCTDFIVPRDWRARPRSREVVSRA